MILVVYENKVRKRFKDRGMKLQGGIGEKEETKESV